MITLLRGTVVEVGGDQAVIAVGGIGFSVFVPGREASQLSRQIGDEALLHTYLHVREDALQLFGFSSPRGREFFLALIGVSGVGPKVALAVMSTYPVAELETAVVRGDTGKFESIPGIGKKLAQRLVLELKDKVGNDLVDAIAAGAGAGESGARPDGEAFVGARSALQGLGLSLREAEESLKGAPEGAPLEELVRFALTKKGDADRG